MEFDAEDVINDEDMESDNSEEDEETLELKVRSLENKISENKFAYQPYIDLIKVLKSLTDLDRLRHARKRMADQFPLSPELWTDWLQDEINVATTPEEKQKVLDLFETAVKDYLSVSLWLQYVSFAISLQNEQSNSEILQTRSIIEKALTAAGLHVTKGAILWDAYMEYEKTLLETYKDIPKNYEKQLKVVANIYKRQLSCPLWGMEETFKKFQNWITENSKGSTSPIIDENMVENIYKKAKEKLDKINQYEENLVSNPENCLGIYKEYLAHEKSKEGSPVRVQCLYERILCDNCLNEEFWLEYIDYADTVLNDCAVVLNICERAVRNCPWCCRIYQEYIKCLEKYEQPQKIITKVVEDAFGSGLQTASDFRDIWMSYLEFLRRNFDLPDISQEEEEKRLEELRAAFAKALEFVFQLQDADPDCTIAQFWARIEAIYCRNMEKSRELWSTILSDERNKTSEMWLEYIHLERTFGDSKHLRKLYPRALQNTKDWPEKIGKAWLNYERDEGTLESFENCLDKIKKVMEQREKEKGSVEPDDPAENQNRKSRKGKPLKKQKKNDSNYNLENENKKTTGYKRKQVDEKVDEGSPVKKFREGEKEEETKDNEEQTNDQLVKRLLEESEKCHGETVIHDPSKDNRTVFVSNLDFLTEESVIREIFSACGRITDLRLVKDYKGRSKGYCYVEFEKSKEAQAALKKDREPINGRPMFVSKCDPDKETRTSGFKYSTNMEKNKLFVRGLPFSTTIEDLRKLFSEFGSLKDLRLVTYRNGHSKGLAYVDFEDEVSAAQAVLKTDGTILQGKEISVAISNPPGRKTETSLTTKLIPSLGGGPKGAGPRGRGRTQISFLPRSVQLNKPIPPANSSANLALTSPLPQNENVKLNNSDFRKLLG